jgi:hypothetical protein
LRWRTALSDVREAVRSVRKREPSHAREIVIPVKIALARAERVKNAHFPCRLREIETQISGHIPSYSDSKDSVCTVLRRRKCSTTKIEGVGKGRVEPTRGLPGLERSDYNKGEHGGKEYATVNLVP